MPQANDACSNQQQLGQWPCILDDYPEALVRIATLRAKKQNHLLFAWVELYPFDMKAPESWKAGETPWESPAKPWVIPGMNGHSLAFSANRMPTSDALNWYFDAAKGKVRIPGAGDLLLLAPQLAPEPKFGRFAVGREAPFTHFWHNGPRVHQLVPITPVPLAVQKLKRSASARQWLEENLGFNPLAFDEWLGSMTLVAPDPVCATLDIGLDRSPQDGTENLTVRAIPRRTLDRQADLSTVTILVGERRAGAWVDLRMLPAVEARFQKLSFPQPMWEIGHALICSKRGLLRMVEPAHWLRSTNFSMGIVSERIKVEVPSGGRRKPAQSYETTRLSDNQKSEIGEIPDDKAADWLHRRISRRKLKSRYASAHQRVFGKSVVGKPNGTENGEDQKLAQEFIVDLIRRAKKRLWLVDPFLGFREARLFALQNANVPLKLITGWDALMEMVDDGNGGKIQQGPAWIADLKGVQAHYKADVRVMPGKNRPAIHDRYIIADWRVWHCGPSFNELGSRLGTVIEVPNPIEVRRIISKIWCRSVPLLSIPPSEFTSEANSPGEDQ